MKRIVSVILLAFCVFLLASCQTTVTTTTSITTTTTTSTSTLSTTAPRIIDSLTIEYDSLTTEAELLQFNLDFEELLQTLQKDGFVFPSEKPIYVRFSPYQYNVLSYQSLILFKSSAQSLSTLENVFFAIYGNFANYGLVYGLSRYYGEKLGIQMESLPELSIRDEISEVNHHLLQLWYVGFIEPYSTPEESLLSKQLSVQLVTYLIENHGFEYTQSLLSKSNDIVEFDLAFTEIRNQWLAYSGSSIRVEVRPVPLAFGYEMPFYRAIWKSPRATWFLYSDYVDFAAQYIDHADYFLSTLDNLITIITTLEDQMAEWDQKLKDPSLRYPVLRISLNRNNSSHSGGGLYSHTLYAFIHEYIHYLTTNWIQRATWLVEGIPLYYTRTYGYEGEVMRKANTPDTDPTIAAFQEYLGREFDFDNDWLDWIDYIIYTSDNYDKTKGTHPIQGISFIRYFIRVYGEETFYMFARNISNAFDLTGRTYEELVEDWIQDVKSRFSDVSMND